MHWQAVQVSYITGLADLQDFGTIMNSLHISMKLLPEVPGVIFIGLIVYITRIRSPNINHVGQVKKMLVH